jgi:hypothetical protein
MMIENIATIANIANPQILILLTEIKGETWNINKLLKIKFLHSNLGFGTIDLKNRRNLNRLLRLFNLMA